jgi:hypothetical protein
LERTIWRSREEAQAETHRLHQTGNRKANRGRKKQSASRAEAYFKPDFRKEAQNGGNVKTRRTLAATTQDDAEKNARNEKRFYGTISKSRPLNVICRRLQRYGEEASEPEI